MLLWVALISSVGLEIATSSPTTTTLRANGRSVYMNNACNGATLEIQQRLRINSPGVQLALQHAMLLLAPNSAFARGTVIVEFLRILAASIHTSPPPSMPYNPTQLPESCKGYHGPSTDLHSKSSMCSCMQACQNFMHYIFTKILRCSHAVLDCASMKAEVWTFPDMSGPVGQSGASIWNRGTGAAIDQLPVPSASFMCNLMSLFFILALVAAI
ncbi:hypothetical protein T10_6955 [Trichinella papuae]|uniref:Uncharacterized protein n=1 Tax=Trichinella papuae TaxID=268474 RepID=A0A0V1N1Q5_9BILA|nr:hypothetical protein T10_6955 [Trichinella papuae]